MKKFLASFLALVMVFTILPSQVKAEQSEVNVTILATSDLHGKIYPYEYSTDSKQEWGLAKIYTLVKQEREKDPNLLLIDNGDTIESNLINLFNKDETHPMIKALNTMKYDTWTIGNHEFNFGLDVLGRAITSFKGYALSANIVKEDGKTLVNPYVIKDVKGVKIGILGLTIPHVKRWEASNPDHYKGLEFLDPLQTAKQYVDILKNQEKVDLIIGTFHLGQKGENYDPKYIDSVQTIAEQVKGIDVIIAGHAHDTLGAKDKQVKFGDTIVVEPASDGKVLAKVDVKLTKQDDKFQVAQKSSDLLSVKDVEPDQSLLSEMKYVDDKSKEESYKKVGIATDDFVKPDEIKGIPQAQIEPTPLLELINKVQLFYTKADVSAAAMFDTRSNLKKGQLQFKDIALIYKFNNTLQAHKISGKNLKAYMEWSASYYNQQKPGDITVSFDQNIRAYNYDMFLGIDYKIDITKSAGERIVNPTIKGEPIKDDKEYVLAINNYRVGTLQGLSLLPSNNESMVFDSTTLDTPEMQRLIQKYVETELKGNLVPTCENNWELIKVDTSNLKGVKDTIDLINNGTIKLPTSEDGRTPNVKSINVLDQNPDLNKETTKKISVPKEEVTQAGTVSYTVKPGDNLTKIAKSYNVDYKQIAKDNKISNPNLIYPNQVLAIKAK